MLESTPKLDGIVQLKTDGTDGWQVLPSCDIALGRLVSEGIVSSIDFDVSAAEDCLTRMSDSSVRPTQVFISLNDRETIGRVSDDGLYGSFGTSRLDDEGRGHVQVAVAEVDFDVETRNDLTEDFMEDGFDSDTALGSANIIKRSRLNTKTQRIIVHELKHVVDKRSDSYYFEASAAARSLVKREHVRYIGLRVIAPLLAGAGFDLLITDPSKSNIVGLTAIAFALTQLALVSRNDPGGNINQEDLIQWDVEVRARNEEARSASYRPMIQLN